MLFGYARVFTADQNPDHQIDALTRAGADRKQIYVDHASGAKASRPQLDELYVSGERTVQQIAELLGVPRTTIYGHLDRTPKEQTAPT